MTAIAHKANSQKGKSLTLKELAEKTQSTVQGDPNLVISGVGSLAQAQAGDISFLVSSKYRAHLATTKASAVIVTPPVAQACNLAALVCLDPKLVLAQVIELLYPYQTVDPHCDKTAVIGEGCEIHPNTYIGPHCVIGNRVKIAADVIIQAGCYIGDDCEIGAGTVLYPRVTVYHGCQIGQYCNIHSGVVIGSDGFGFVKNKEQWLKVGQIGGVKIGNHVEIGANTTIDRGAIEDTEIGDHVILDNLIQIAHNVKIGDGTAIAACTGIAGSTVIGKHCLIGGGTMIIGHIVITDYVNLVGCTNVGQSILKPGAYGSGITANEIKTWKKNLVRFHQLDNLAMRLIEIERKLKAQEEA